MQKPRKNGGVELNHLHVHHGSPLLHFIVAQPSLSSLAAQGYLHTIHKPNLCLTPTALHLMPSSAPIIIAPIIVVPVTLLTLSWHCQHAQTMSGRTGSVLAWHTHGRVFKPRLLQQVLRFVARIHTVKYVDLEGYCP